MEAYGGLTQIFYVQPLNKISSDSLLNFSNMQMGIPLYSGLGDCSALPLAKCTWLLSRPRKVFQPSHLIRGKQQTASYSGQI